MSKFIMYGIKHIVFTVIAITTLALQPISAQQAMLSEQPYFECFRTGLPSPICKCIIEDSDEFIWVGTKNGIARFDGVHMQVFLSKEQFSSDLISDFKYDYDNDVSYLYEDTIHRRIWISMTDGTLSYLDKRDYKIKEFAYECDSQTPKSAPIKYMVNVDPSTLIISKSIGGVHKIDILTGKTTRVTSNLNDDKYFSLLDTNNPTRMYALHHNRPYRMMLRGDRAFLQKLDIQDELSRVAKLQVVNDSMLLLVSLKNVVYTYNIRTHECDVKAKTPSRVSSIAYGNDGIWFSTNMDGLYYYNFSESKLYNYTTQNSYLQDNSISFIIRSRNQPIIWAATKDGIIKNDYFNSKFVMTDLRTCSESKACNVYMIFKDMRDYYWVWSIDGLFRRAPKSQKFETVKDPLLASRRMTYQAVVQDTINKKLFFSGVHGIMAYDMTNNKFSLVCGQRGGWQMCLVKNKLIHVSKNAVTMFDTKTSKILSSYDCSFGSFVSSIANDGDSVLWFGTVKSSLYKFNLSSGVFTKVKDAICKTNGETDGRINKILLLNRCNERELWMSTSKCGLFYFLPDKNVAVKVDDSSYLNSVQAIEADVSNNVWVSTLDGVVCINNQNGRTYEYSNKSYALCREFHVNVSSVDVKGNILMGGANSFIEFRTDNFEINKYYPKPVAASFKYLNSQTYTFDDFTDVEQFAISDTLKIPCGIRSMQLFVRVLNLSEPDNNYIEWRMVDVDKKWIKARTTSPITFSNLRMGDHILEIRSCDRNKQPLAAMVRTICVRKEIFFYEHPSFFITLILGVIMFVMTLFYWRTRSLTFQKINLVREVERKSGEIIRTNVELLSSREHILKQNEELTIHREYLEEQVAKRTVDLEVACHKAEESNQLKTAFLANLSHEIRTPMNCIVGFAKLLADPSCSRDEQKEFVHLIMESGQTLLVLIGDLLDISRIESGQMEINLTTVSIESELRDLHQMLLIERKYPDTQLFLTLDESLSGRSFVTDKTRFKQININLVYNALKFSPKGYVKLNATIIRKRELSQYNFGATITEPDKEVLLICVEDTGIGIPEDKQKVIFEPFRKLNAKKTLYPGLGLGLSIVRKFVIILHGEIWVKSIVGVGSTFYFYLPIENDTTTT